MDRPIRDPDLAATPQKNHAWRIALLIYFSARRTNVRSRGSKILSKLTTRFPRAARRKKSIFPLGSAIYITQRTVRSAGDIFTRRHPLREKLFAGNHARRRDFSLSLSLSLFLSVQRKNFSGGSWLVPRFSTVEEFFSGRHKVSSRRASRSRGWTSRRRPPGRGRRRNKSILICGKSTSWDTAAESVEYREQFWFPITNFPRRER